MVWPESDACPWTGRCHHRDESSHSDHIEVVRWLFLRGKRCCSGKKNSCPEYTPTCLQHLPESSVSRTWGLHSENLAKLKGANFKLPGPSTNRSNCLSVCMVKNEGFALGQTRVWVQTISYQWWARGNDLNSKTHFPYLGQEITRRLLWDLKGSALTVSGALPGTECAQGSEWQQIPLGVDLEGQSSRSAHIVQGFGKTLSNTLPRLSGKPGIVHHCIHEKADMLLCETWPLVKFCAGHFTLNILI